jgi:hypothetical protein
MFISTGDPGFTIPRKLSTNCGAAVANGGKIKRSAKT